MAAPASSSPRSQRKNRALSNVDWGLSDPVKAALPTRAPTPGMPALILSIQLPDETTKKVSVTEDFTIKVRR